MRLENKVIIVIGGAGLLGSEVCKHVSENGGKCIVADFDLEKALDLANRIDGAIAQQIDINNKESCLNLIEEVSNKFSKIDAVVNLAYPRNKQYGRKFEEVEYSDFCENMNVHLGGYFLVSQCFVDFFGKQGFGNIINFSSIYGVIAPKFEVYSGTPMTMPVEYAAIKAGVIHLSKYIAKYCKGKNIRVNTISPGGIEDSQPSDFLKQYKDFCLNKGMLDKQDLMGAVIFCLSDDSKFMNGQNLIIDDGFSL